MSLEEVTKFLNNTRNNQLANAVLDVFGNHAQSFDQYDDVSKCCFKIKDYKNSIKWGEKALSISSTSEQMYICRSNLINVYNHFNYPEKALRYIKANETVVELDLDRDLEKAYSLFLLNRKSEARDLLLSKENSPDLTEDQKEKIRFNLGTYCLIDGKFQEGLQRFILSDLRGTCSFLSQEIKYNYGLPLWNGIISPGLNLLIIAEAGIGDEIINVRFVKDLSKFGINCIWLTLPSRDELTLIYKENGISAYSNFVDIPKEFTNNCYYLPSMRIPIALNLEYKDLWKEHYLNKIPDTLSYKWNNILKTDKKLKIGLRWQGSPEYDQDLHRSIPLKEIINHIPPISAELFSIQKDNGMEQLEDFDNVIDLSNKLDTLLDLFTCINNLDIIITSCTSCAHIAAAMGKKVFVIVPISCYYVWCQPGYKSNWYSDNVIVLYQKTPRIWDEPLSLLTQLLSEISK